MKTRDVVGISGGVILLLIVTYYSIPNPGKKALRREESALSTVASWGSSTQISRNGRVVVSRTESAWCPDKEHIVQRAMGDSAEYIRIGDDIYYRQNGSQWAKGTPGPDLLLPLPTVRPCLSNPGEPSYRPPGGAEEMRLELESEIKDAHIEKGEIKDDKGVPCQEWAITQIAQNNKLGSQIACLDEKSHLPRYIRNENDSFRESFEWDPSVMIEPPDMNPRRTLPATH